MPGGKCRPHPLNETLPTVHCVIIYLYHTCVIYYIILGSEYASI